MSQVIQNMSKKNGKPQRPLNDNQEAAQKQFDKMPDPVALSQALMNAFQRSQPRMLEMMERYSEQATQNPPQALDPDPMNLMEASLDMMSALAANPFRYWALQMEYAGKQAELFQNCKQKFWGEDVAPIIEPKKNDRRFNAPEWSDTVLFDFIKQYYLLACDFVTQTLDATEGLSGKKKDKLSFIARIFMEALSPSNFIFTNPEVLNETIKTGGENLVKGFENFAQDLARGKGELKISTTDYNAFKLGDNLATTPGQVVFENDLIQLIQYEPSTPQVFKRPLLVVPPWINKFYILDLRPESSYIRWAVEQGHTVFCVSWVNPDASLAHKTFSHYMTEGVLASLDKIREITGEPDCNAVGYCLGGTLLTTTMAYLSAQKQGKRIASATFLTTLVDFSEAGEMKLFTDKLQIEAMEKIMARDGVLPASELQRTFKLLRANDLIWSFVVNNYLMGRDPFPFDLLYWNDDSTNMPAAAHNFCLKNFYRDNLLVQPNALEINGVPIDISVITTPCYFLSTREDHIAPWKATYKTTALINAPKTFTLAGSGHIAGVINPPAKNKYQYWTASETPANPEKWLAHATEHAGSWWPHWQSWLADHAGGKTAPRIVPQSIESAPGRYVMVQGT